MMINEPLLTICFRTSTVPQIKNELKTFGLNPRDWDIINPQIPSSLRPAKLILVHRDDEDVRLAVKLYPDADNTPATAIETVEWLITGA